MVLSAQQISPPFILLALIAWITGQSMFNARKRGRPSPTSFGVSLRTCIVGVFSFSAASRMESQGATEHPCFRENDMVMTAVVLMTSGLQLDRSNKGIESRFLRHRIEVTGISLAFVEEHGR